MGSDWKDENVQKLRAWEKTGFSLTIVDVVVFYSSTIVKEKTGFSLTIVEE